MPDRERALAALEELWAGLPTVECQGQCWNACGPIAMSMVEREVISEAGVQIPEFTEERSEAWARDEPLHCPALTVYKQCSVYEVRPTVCRIWGTGRGQLACPWGCTVTGTRLRTPDVLRLLNEAYRIGGSDLGMDGAVLDDALLDDPVVGALMTRFVNGERGVKDQLAEAIINLTRQQKIAE